jgi:hypothetical protein
MPRTPKTWLVVANSKQDDLPTRWLPERADLLRSVRLPDPHRPSGISRGDFLVLYAKGAQVCFAVAKAGGAGKDADFAKDTDGAWWYHLPISVQLSVHFLARAPKYDSVGIGADQLKGIPFFELTNAQYDAIIRAMCQSASRPD